MSSQERHGAASSSSSACPSRQLEVRLINNIDKSFIHVQCATVRCGLLLSFTSLQCTDVISCSLIALLNSYTYYIQRRVIVDQISNCSLFCNKAEILMQMLHLQLYKSSLKFLTSRSGKPAQGRASTRGRVKQWTKRWPGFSFAVMTMTNSNTFYLWYILTLIRAVVVAGVYFEVHCVPNKHIHVIKIK